jgi:hypothetical protein
MNPPAPGIYSARIRYEFGAQESIWHQAPWDGQRWHLPPYYTLVQWIPSDAAFG